MRRTYKPISNRWRIVTIAVLFVWVTTRGLCIAAPFLLEGCCTEAHDTHAAVTPAHVDHEHDNHSHEDDHSDHNGAAGHHSEEDTGKPADSGKSSNCCDDDATLVKTEVLSGKSLTPAVLWLIAALSIEVATKAPSVVANHSPPVSLHTLSLLLLGPGHQPHGPPPLL